jgi:hypothetical protein
LKCISKSCLFWSGPSRTHLLHWWTHQWTI